MDPKPSPHTHTSIPLSTTFTRKCSLTPQYRLHILWPSWHKIRTQDKADSPKALSQKCGVSFSGLCLPKKEKAPVNLATKNFHPISSCSGKLLPSHTSQVLAVGSDIAWVYLSVTDIEVLSRSCLHFSFQVRDWKSKSTGEQGRVCKVWSGQV